MSSPASTPRARGRVVAGAWVVATLVAAVALPGAGLLVAAASLVPRWRTTTRVTATLFALALVILVAQIVGLGEAGSPELRLGTGGPA